MKNNYFYLRKNCNNNDEEVICKYEFSFNNTIDIFLEKLVEKYSMHQSINLHEEIDINVESEENIRKLVVSEFGANKILAYFDKDGAKTSHYVPNCVSVKFTRPPVIYDIIARFLEYQREIPFDENDSFADVLYSNLINEISAWYSCSNVSAIKLYSELDAITFEQRTKSNVDVHISLYEKREIIRNIFTHLKLKRVEEFVLYELNTTINILNGYNTENINLITSEINKSIESSRKNNEFLESVGFNIKYVDELEKSSIVVLDGYGLIADRNKFSGKITRVTKCYNNDSKKNNVYYEVSDITVGNNSFFEAEAEDIYTYRQLYYLPDGTRPFINMTVEEIETYLKENN